MKDSNADEILEKLQKKSKLERNDLIPILLCPLMNGTMKIKDRILLGIKMIRNEEKNLSNDEANKMQAVLYAFASKFLKGNEMEEIKEAISMTILGQMLVEDGIKRGKIQGVIETCKELGLSREDTLSKIKTKFDLTEEEAEKYLLKFW